MQWHGDVCCHLMWNESHPVTIRGKYLFTLVNLFKAARIMCSDMKWLAKSAGAV